MSSTCPCPWHEDNEDKSRIPKDIDWTNVPFTPASAPKGRWGTNAAGDSYLACPDGSYHYFNTNTSYYFSDGQPGVPDAPGKSVYISPTSKRFYTPAGRQINSNRDGNKPGGKETKENSLSGKKFVFTGTLRSLSREEAQALVRYHGGRVRNVPNRRTSYVVLGRGVSDIKLRTIRELGVKTLDEDGFLELVGRGGDGESVSEERPGDW